MSIDFNILLLEGIFYQGPNLYPDSLGIHGDGFRNLWVTDGQGGHPLSVYDALKPFVGKSVVFSAHHLPPMPINPALWGGGCCRWEGLSPTCPFGHHDHPTRLYNVSGQGHLVYDLDHSKSEGGWWLEKLEGTREMLPLAHALCGHSGRIAAVELFSAEQVQKVLTGDLGDLGGLEALGEKATGLRDLLEQLSKIKGTN